MNSLPEDCVELIYRFNPVTYNKLTFGFRELKVKYDDDLTTEILLTFKSKIISIECNYNITNEGIKHLTQLRSLNLSSNKTITDEGIKPLTQLKNLNLFNNNTITDEGIKHLTQLRNLNLAGNRTITKKGIKHLKICKIIR